MEIQVLASGSKGNAYFVSDGETPLLIECGLSLESLQQKLHYGLSKIAACLVSHSHKDHSKTVPKLLARGIDCYMSKETAEALGVSQHHRMHFLEEGLYQIGTWVVLCFEAVHDVPCLGFLLATRDEKLLYLTDSAYCKYRFNEITHLMVACNYDMGILKDNIEAGTFERAAKSRVIHSHANLDTIKKMLQANDLSKVKGIWLLHLSDRNADAEMFKREIQELIGKPVYVG